MNGDLVASDPSSPDATFATFVIAVFEPDMRSTRSIVSEKSEGLQRLLTYSHIMPCTRSVGIPLDRAECPDIE